MYTKGQKAGTVQFKVKPGAGAKEVSVAGTFSGWKPVAMRRQKDGSFAVAVPVPAGRSEYKFVIDGRWIHDTDVPAVAMNAYGTFNSVIVAG